jgi:DNA adenine methylase
MIKPLFMWAGGKAKMLKYHAPYLPASCNTYSEPFFGGGAMYLHIQKTLRPEKCYINDVNSGIVNIYRNVKEDPAEFCGIVDTYQRQYLELDKVGRKRYYYDLRHEHAYNYEGWSAVSEAATLYFLMKTGFNGIWQINKNTNNRYGTPCGLLNQTDKVYDKANVLAWSELLQNTEIFCDDYSNCPSGELNYFDPPYRDSFADYGTGWGDVETEKLLQHVNSLDGNVLFCNRCDGTDFFESRKGKLNLATFPVTYTAGRRKKVGDNFEAKKATEVLLYS